MAQAWEYRSIVIGRKTGQADFTIWFDVGPDGAKQLSGTVDAARKANEFGAQGWELVSVTAVSNAATSGAGSGYSDTAGFTNSVLYWFKRLKA